MGCVPPLALGHLFFSMVVGRIFFASVLLLIVCSGLDGEGQMKHFIKDDGFNTFRLPTGWQFLTNEVLGGTLHAGNWAKYDALMQVSELNLNSCYLLT